jgi:hypothetical protein
MEVSMAEAHKRAYRHPKYKTSYRIKNWPEYEKSLRNRSDITVWLSRDAIDVWTLPKNGKRGGQLLYSDIAIETSILLRLVFHLPLRQAEGFLKSILKLMDLYIPCPDHTTVSRRNRTANIRRLARGLSDDPLNFIVDSTGLKICGQGEWHAKKHGERWRKGRKKLHLGVDENGRILASKVTDGHEQDPSQVPNLLAQVDREIDRFVGDRIYDQEAVYEAVGHHSLGAEVIRRKKTRCCPTIPSVFPLIETVILRRSGARDGPSGNVSLDTICRVTRKTHSIVTRESLVEG